MQSMLDNGYDAITQLELWDFVRTYEPENGYVFSRHPLVKKIIDKMESLPNAPGHSGSSFGITMRNLQFVAKHGIEMHKQGFRR